MICSSAPLAAHQPQPHQLEAHALDIGVTMPGEAAVDGGFGDQVGQAALQKQKTGQRPVREFRWGSPTADPPLLRRHIGAPAADARSKCARRDDPDAGSRTGLAFYGPNEEGVAREALRCDRVPVGSELPWAL